MKEVIESQIRELLKLDVSAVTLSHLLFAQFGGLFGQLASTEQERRAISQTPLFRQANARITELAARDSAPLRREVDLINAALARGKAAAAAGVDANGAPTTPSTTPASP